MLAEPAFAAVPVSCLDALADPKARVAACTRALEKSESAAACVARANALADDAQWALAIADLGKALALDPKHVEALTARAGLHELMRDRGRALADIALRELARAGVPDEPYARFGRGVALQRLGDKAGAATAFKSARAQNPGIDREFAAMGVTP